MSDKRFNWSRADKLTAAFELKRRDVLRVLQKDSDLNCLVCGKKPKRKENCYYPAVGLARTNIVIGHVECVDHICAKHVAQSTGIPLSEDNNSLMDEILSENKDRYESGFQDGYRQCLLDIREKQRSVLQR